VRMRVRWRVVKLRKRRGVQLEQGRNVSDVFRELPSETGARPAASASSTSACTPRLNSLAHTTAPRMQLTYQWWFRWLITAGLVCFRKARRGGNCWVVVETELRTDRWLSQSFLSSRTCNYWSREQPLLTLHHSKAIRCHGDPLPIRSLRPLESWAASSNLITMGQFC